MCIFEGAECLYRVMWLYTPNDKNLTASHRASGGRQSSSFSDLTVTETWEWSYFEHADAWETLSMELSQHFFRGSTHPTCQFSTLKRSAR